MATSPCPKCGKQITSPPCVFCGYRGSAQANQAGLIGCLGAVAVIALIVVVMLSGSDSSERDHSTMAVIQCQHFVRDRLRAPSTADFPFLDHSTRSAGSDRYVVTSYVDAQNGFGATIRNNWRCEIQFSGGEEADRRNWRLINLDMS
jgi:hypothetical protein